MIRYVGDEDIENYIWHNKYEYKWIQYPVTTNIMDCSLDNKYKIDNDSLRQMGVNESKLDYYSDNSDIKYKKYPTFVQLYKSHLKLKQPKTKSNKLALNKHITNYNKY